MATVYLATQQSLGRRVALKTLRTDSESAEEGCGPLSLSSSLALTDRFVDEARIVAGLSHPHIVQIHDVGATETFLYICMEYVPGGDLQSRVGAPFPPGQALDIVMRLGLALEAAHRHGIVHRDVKPGNILFRDDGTPLLSDFGIAKDLRRASDLTTTGHVLGSPFYISPEQAESIEVDGRADLYSLGVILFELLTGRRPFDGVTAIKVILQHLQAPVPRLPDELSGFQDLVDRLLAKDPDRRFQSAREMVLCARALSGAPVTEAGAVADRPTVSALLPRRAEKGHVSIPEEVVEKFRRGIFEDIAADRVVLPSLPDVVVEVRRQLESPRSTSATIAAAISLDPALSAQVLRVANSAFYFGKAPVKGLGRAIVRLGSSVVQQVVMMLSVAAIFGLDRRPSLKAQLTVLWEHSTLVAAICERIARRTPGLGRDEALLCGLIHDLGVYPVLVWAEPIPSLMARPEHLDALAAALGGEVGAAILERWCYPKELVAVPAGHADLHRQVPAADYVDVVQCADLLAGLPVEAAECDAGPRAAGAPDSRIVAEGVEWWSLPAAQRLRLGRSEGLQIAAAAREGACELAAALQSG